MILLIVLISIGAMIAIKKGVIDYYKAVIGK